MTHKVERILVAVDDSPAAASALAEAIALATDEHASLVVAHVVSILGESFVPHSGAPERVPDRGQTTVLVDAEAQAVAAGIDCTTELLIGYAPKQLALLGEELDVDLIVVGSRHLTGFKRALLGSTSRELLTETKRAVLVVPSAPVGAPVPA